MQNAELAALLILHSAFCILILVMHRIIRRRTGLAAVDLPELWEYRELLGFLAWRDIVVRYKQTTIGVLWAFIRPFLTMVIFTVVFGRIAKLPSDGVPYAVFTFTALLPWQFFSTAFAETAGSIVGNGYMISKIYFPRLILPLASIAVGIVDFLVSFVILIFIMIGYRTPVVGARVGAAALLPALRRLHDRPRASSRRRCTCGIATCGTSSRSSRSSGCTFRRSRTARRRCPAKWRLLYSLNPMVAVIDGFRWSLLGTTPLYVPGIIAGNGDVDRAARRRPLLLQSDRADFRGRDVMNDAVIAQGIGKTYRLGEQGDGVRRCCASGSSRRSRRRSETRERRRRASRSGR